MYSVLALLLSVAFWESHFAMNLHVCLLVGWSVVGSSISYNFPERQGGSYTSDELVPLRIDGVVGDGGDMDACASLELGRHSACHQV